jgi:hypothetical protein
MAKFSYVTVDAQHPAGLARFWAAALDGYAVRAYDEAEIQRLASLGLTPDTDTSVMVDGPGPTLCFQKMPGRTIGRNRLHFDLVGHAREQEVERLCALGARSRHSPTTYDFARSGRQSLLRSLPQLGARISREKQIRDSYCISDFTEARGNTMAIAIGSEFATFSVF